MRIAYLILAHKNPSQLQRLIRRLSGIDTDIFIHVDSKADEVACENAFFIKHRIDVSWGAFSMVEATLGGLREIVGHGSYDYICLLSGLDYPIKSNNYIRNFFTRCNGTEFIYYRPDPSPELPLGGSDRFRYYYDYDSKVTGSNEYELEMKERGLERPFLAGMTPYHGSQWWSLTGRCVEWLLRYIEFNKEPVNYYRYTKFPDEQFFQTLVMNSDYSGNVYNNNLRYIDWSNINWPLIDWTTVKPHPKILDIHDYGSLKRTDRLFARKFDADSGRLMDMIDAGLLR